MKNIVKYYIHANPMYISTSLFNVYNSHVFGEYINYIKKAKYDEEMYCIIITLTGNAKIYHNDGKTESLTPHSIYFTQLSAIQKMISTDNEWHALFYWFMSQNINLPHNKKFILKDIDIHKEERDADKIISLLQMQTEPKLQLANSFFCYKLCSCLEIINVQFNKTMTIIDKIILFINENADNNISVYDLAKEFNYSEKHIHHLFTTTLDISPKQFITNVRMQKVCFLLKTTNLTLQNIADKLCFSTPSHLANSFKDHFGISPSQYRKVNKDLLLPRPQK